MIRQSRFVIAVRDLAATADFYRDALGFEIHEFGDPGWRLLKKNSCEIMAGECPDAPPAGTLGDHSYFAYLVVDDVDACCEQARRAGAELVKPLQDEPWGMREFGVRTVDGHRIMLGQEL